MTISIQKAQVMKMRVISGSARGRKLSTPEDKAIRPTTDNVKESIFNIIQFDIEGRRVLDLFAGTGQLGIECLSRGAKSAVFIDQSPQAVKIVKDNLRSLGLQGTVLRQDSLAYLRSAPQFDLIFIDPPYEAGMYAPALEIINSVDILSDGGIMICESQRDERLPELSAPYKKGREYRYGKVKLTLYTKEKL